MTGIDFSSLDKVGVVAFCVLIVLAFIKGWIVPGPAVDRQLKDKDEQISNLRKIVDVRDEQLERLSEVGRTVDAVLQSIKDLAERRRRSP